MIYEELHGFTVGDYVESDPKKRYFSRFPDGIAAGFISELTTNHNDTPLATIVHANGMGIGGTFDIRNFKKSKPSWDEINKMMAARGLKPVKRVGKPKPAPVISLFSMECIAEGAKKEEERARQEKKQQVVEEIDRLRQELHMKHEEMAKSLNRVKNLLIEGEGSGN